MFDTATRTDRSGVHPDLKERLVYYTAACVDFFVIRGEQSSTQAAALLIYQTVLELGMDSGPVCAGCSVP